MKSLTERLIDKRPVRIVQKQGGSREEWSMLSPSRHMKQKAGQ